LTKHKIASLPFAVWMLIFTILPLGMVIWFAFTDSKGTFTFDNILKIADFSETFLISILLGALATLICLVMAYPVAFIISRTGERVQQTLVMLTMMPMWMNFLLRTYAWMSILEDKGFINQFLGLLGMEPIHMINTRFAVVVGMVYNFLPFMIIPLYSVMVKIDKSIIEAAEDLGSNGFQVFRRILLPLSAPGIVTGITMVFVPAVSTFVISKLLGGGKEWLIGDFIENYFIGTAKDYNIGSALSLVLMVLILLCMAVTGLVDRDEEKGGIGG